MKKHFFLIMIGTVLLLSASGCGKQKYKLNYGGYGFESRKAEYAAGETVTVYYDFIATDTDYRFTIDEDVTMKQSYDNAHGYIFSFTMPDHDVTLHVESHNSMLYIPPLDQMDAGINGLSISQGDITDFTYTYDWSGYNALYQRYRFYTEDGAYWFCHETRKIENDYGWASEADITASGTIALTIYDWTDFLEYLADGSTAEPEESVVDGDSGPWMYLSFKSGESTERREFHFASADRRLAFEAFCQSLAENH